MKRLALLGLVFVFLGSAALLFSSAFTSDETEPSGATVNPPRETRMESQSERGRARTDARAEPASVAQASVSAELSQSIDELLMDNPAHLAVAIYRPGEGLVFSRGSEEPFPLASAIKLYILAAYL